MVALKKVSQSVSREQIQNKCHFTDTKQVKGSNGNFINVSQSVSREQIQNKCHFTDTKQVKGSNGSFKNVSQSQENKFKINATLLTRNSQ